MQGVGFEFELTSFGWATLAVTSPGGSMLSMARVSNLSDVLGDVVDAVASVCVDGEASAVVIAHQRDHEVTFGVRRQLARRADSVVIDLGGRACHTSDAALVAAVLTGCRRIDRRRYAAEWPYPFPLVRLQRLQKLSAAAASGRPAPRSSR